MNFSLNSLSRSFNSEKNNNGEYLAYAFILGTTTDNIFPELFAFYPELNELTSRYISVIAPIVKTDISGTLEERRKEYLELFSSGLFYNIYKDRKVDVSRRLKEFLDLQMSESLAFARFCGVRVDSLPCILFFSDLNNPSEYILWKLRDSSSKDIIKYFRKIIAEIEENYNDYFALEENIQKLKDETQAIEIDLENSDESLKSSIHYFEEALKEKQNILAQRRIIYEQRLEKLDPDSVKYGKKLDEGERKINGIIKEVNGITAALENAERDKSHFDNLTKIKQLQKIAGNKNKLIDLIKQYDILSQKLPPALDIISSVDKEVFRSILLKEVKKSVPLVNLGFSGIGLFT